MKKYIFLLLTAIVSISLTGCVTVKKVVRERVDQNIAGNQGYIQGSGKASTEPRATEREYIDIKVELPTWEELHAKPAKQDDKPKRVPRRRISNDTEVTGNKGYLVNNAGVEKDLPVHSQKPPQKKISYEYDEIEAEIVSDDEVVVNEVVVYEEEVIRPAYQEYTVKKGDTLSHIAKAFYNKASRWTVIYEANADKLKDPSSLMPGTVLLIPDIEEAEFEYIK